MQFRPLGRSGLQVSPLCFGGNVFGWTVDEKTAFSLLDAWVDNGFNFIDTADVYSRWVPGNEGGESETIIGRWLAQGGGRRDKVVLCTKVGNAVGLAPERIREGIDASLRRLQVERVDIYLAHKDDPNTPMEAVLETFAHLVKQGKVRSIGASNFSAARLSQALQTSTRMGLPRYESLQPGYNLYDRAGFEQELQGLCQREEIGVFSYYALAAGFLSGKYRTGADTSASARGASVVAKYLNERGLKILAALDEAARDSGSTPSQVAIAWVLAQPGITAPIASATSLVQLHDLMTAARLKLDPQVLARLNAASA